MTIFKKIMPIVFFAISFCFATESIAFAGSHGQTVSNTDKEHFKVWCSKVELLDANLDMTPPVGPASGPANFVIGGEPIVATATVELMGPPQPQPDGSANILVRLQYDFGGGNVLFAFARGVLTETDRLGVFENNALISYIGGTGIYEKAYGRFDATGFLNFADFIVEMAGNGEVCNRGR